MNRNYFTGFQDENSLKQEEVKELNSLKSLCLQMSDKQMKVLYLVKTYYIENQPQLYKPKPLWSFENDSLCDDLVQQASTIGLSLCVWQV